MTPDRLGLMLVQFLAAVPWLLAWSWRDRTAAGAAEDCEGRAAADGLGR